MSSFLLKLIACISMLIDHTGLILFSNNTIFRIIGRIAMPIFAFQVGVGFRKTHSKSKYILRMIICALISQIPFLLMLNIYTLKNIGIFSFPLFSLNICFNFSIALLTLYFMELGKKNKIFFIVSFFLVLLSVFIPMDYNIWALLIVIWAYFFHNKKILFSIGLFFITILHYCFKSSYIQLFMLLALPFIWLYNGKKGKSLKYYFYIFYPLHMLLITIIKLIITS